MNTSARSTVPRQIRVLIVEGNHLIRQATRQGLEDYPQCEVIGESRNAVEALRHVAVDIPDVVLMDSSMPGIDGLVITKHLKRRYPRVRIIIHSFSFDTRERNRALEAGADAFLMNASASRLAFAIQEVAAERGYLVTSGAGGEDVIPDELTFKPSEHRFRLALKNLNTVYPKRGD